MATVTGLTAERMVEIEAAVNATRRAVIFQTTNIASMADENVNVNVDASALAFAITANRASRIRAYSTSEQRIADAEREIGVDADDGSGLLLEVVFTDVLLQIKPLSPAAVLVNFNTPVDDTIYFSVQNRDDVSGAVVISVTVMRVE